MKKNEKQQKGFGNNIPDFMKYKWGNGENDNNKNDKNSSKKLLTIL